MLAIALDCVRCGAPLPMAEPGAFLLCVYCNTPHRLAFDADAHGPRAEPTEIGEADVARIRELIALGRRDEAIAIYRAAAACSHAEAEAAIAAWGAQLAQSLMMKGQLNGVGWAISALAWGLLAAGVLALVGVVGEVPAGVAVGMMAVGGVVALVFLTALIRTVRYLGASSGEATIARFTLVGTSSVVLAYRMLLDVRGRRGEAFRTELTMAARPETRARVYVGRRFRVKYFAGDPGSVIFAGQARDA